MNELQSEIVTSQATDSVNTDHNLGFNEYKKLVQVFVAISQEAATVAYIC